MFTHTHRPILIDVLNNGFNKAELISFAFRIGLDSDNYKDRTKQEIIDLMIERMERTDQLGCFIREIIKIRDDEKLVKLLSEYPCIDKSSKVEIVVRKEFAHKANLISTLAAIFNVNEDEITIIAAASGSLRLLVNIPARSIDIRRVLKAKKGFEYKEIVSFVLFEFLSHKNQNTWQYIYTNKPYLIEGSSILPQISWPQATREYTLQISEGESSRRSSLPRPRTSTFNSGENESQYMETADTTPAENDIHLGVNADILPPVVNLSPSIKTIPVPGHQQRNDRYKWYLVETRPLSEFMPEINMGDWLLVDLQPGLTQDLHDTEQPILVVMNEEIDGTIRVRPSEPKASYQRTYLVTLTDSPTGAFRIDEATGNVSFSSEMAEIGVSHDEILGVVVGFWRPFFESVQTRSLQTGIVDLELAVDFRQFALEEQDQFVVELSRVINISPDEVRIIYVASGSVKITLEMPEEAAAALMSMFFSGESELSALPIMKVEVIRDPGALIADRSKVSAAGAEHLNRAKLREFTANYFNETELRDICFDLKVDYEGLPGQGKRDKARELVAFLERHGRIDELVSICCQRRPNIAGNLGCDGVNSENR